MKQALIAVGVFAGLLVVVLATRDRGNVNVGVPKLVLPAVDKAKITSIEVYGAQTVTLKKEATGWMVAGPSKAFHVADEAQVNALGDAIAMVKATQFITDRAQRFAELEVDEVKGLGMKVFTSGTTAAIEVVFGKPGKLGGTYLRASKGDAVFLTDSPVAQLLRKDEKGWRKRGFFPASLDQLAKLKVKLEDGASFDLEAKPDGTWALLTAAPAGFRFDAAAATRLAAALVGTSAVDFVDAPADALVGPTFEVELKDGKKVVVRQGAADAAGLVPTRVDGDPQGYLVAADHSAQLRKRLVDLRDTHLVAFEPAKAKKLVIQVGGKKTIVANEGGTWRLLEPKQLPPGLEFDPARVMGQLGALKSLMAARVEDVSEAKAGLAKPSATLEVFVEGAATQTVKFGAAMPSGQLYVMGSADSLVYGIDAQERTRWEAGPELFKKLPKPDVGQMQGFENLPPEIRRQIEAQFRQQPPQPQ